MLHGVYALIVKFGWGEFEYVIQGLRAGEAAQPKEHEAEVSGCKFHGDIKLHGVALEVGQATSRFVT